MTVPLSITIPLRFILTMGHFIVTLLVFWHKVCVCGGGRCEDASRFRRFARWCV